MSIQIPERLKAILDSDLTLHGALHEINRKVAAILSDNKLPFFPGYTDHGVAHVTDVLATMDRLIPGEVFELKLLKPADVVVMTLGALLHDLAMHLREHGFKDLIEGQWPSAAAKANTSLDAKRFGDRPWPDLWRDYLAEAKRWDDAKLERIFGSREQGSTTAPAASDPGRDPWTVRPLHNNVLLWDEYDKLLVGEFIRRHHARLGHEFAHYGFPGLGKDKDLPEVDQDFPTPASQLPKKHRELADLGGLVARSHWLSLREAADDVEKRYPKQPRPLECVPMFHMALLRVADYLQLEYERAPSALLHLRDPASPLSLQEWNKHKAVQQVSWDHDDPGSVFVRVDAQHSLLTHLQLKELLAGLQREMDSSTAVLAEVYGVRSQIKLDRLRLAKGRVRTNLDDKPNLLDKLPYIAERITFSTAGPQLLELLIRPLYRNDWSAGLREMVQNAVDAVRERICRDGPIRSDPGGGPTRTKDADVEVKIEADQHGHFWIEVADRGIGMTVEVVRDFFLKAGASFRTTEAWKRDFAGSAEIPTVLRTGRFGIGALAVFLLGDEIEVETRSVHEMEALRFTAKLGTDPIAVNRCRAPIGTTIRCRVRHMRLESELAELQGYLKDASESDLREYFAAEGEVFHPFRMDDVGVLTRLFTKEVAIEDFVSGPDSEIRLPWRRVKIDENLSVDWSWFEGNGCAIRVNGFSLSQRLMGGKGFVYKNVDMPKSLGPCPSLSVIDRTGRFPLSLQRHDVASDWWRALNGLWKAVEPSSVACWLALGSDKPSLGEKTPPPIAFDQMRVVQRQSNSLSTHFSVPWLSMGLDVVASGSLHASQLIRRVAFFIRSNPKNSSSVADSSKRFPIRQWCDEHQIAHATLARTWPPGFYQPMSWASMLFSANATRDQSLGAGWRSVVLAMNGAELVESNSKLLPYEFERLASGATLAWEGTRPSHLSIEDLERSLSAMGEFELALIYELDNPDLLAPPLGEQASNNADGVGTWTSRVARKYFDGPVILPVDLGERRQKYAALYRDLDPYIREWEAWAEESGYS